MTASLKESAHPPADDLHLHGESAIVTDRDQEFVRLLNEAGVASELDATELSIITDGLDEPRIDTRRMEILERYYRGRNDATAAARRCTSDRFFMHDDDFSVSAHQLVAWLATLNPEITPIQLQRIGADDGPLVLRAGESFSAVSDEEDEDSERGTVAVRALVRALNALLAKADVAVRLVPLVPDDSRELYLGVTEDGAMSLLQGGCTSISAVAALREFAGW